MLDFGETLQTDVVVVGGSAWFVGALRSIFDDGTAFSLSQSVETVAALDLAGRAGAPLIAILACGSGEREVRQLNQRARRVGIDLRVVVKHHQLRADLVRDAMEAGAWGCFCADDAPETVLHVLFSVAHGRASFPFVDFSALRDDPFEHLTRREREVLEVLAKGWSNLQISARLGISENTVKYHLKVIYNKLDVSNRTAAITRFLQRERIAA